MADWQTLFCTVSQTFEQSLTPARRHQLGVHFTPIREIAQVLEPTLLRPWQRRIAQAAKEELLLLRKELASIRILDPACGAGNFLLAAFFALTQLEAELVQKLLDTSDNNRNKAVSLSSIPSLFTRQTSLHQLFGIDIQRDALVAARILLKEAQKGIGRYWNERFLLESSPPDAEQSPRFCWKEHLLCQDALFTDWPRFNLIVGNPPFQSKNNLTRELGLDYFHRLQERYPEIPGRADLCAYWFYRAHQLMKPGQRAGFIATDTIRQNYTRQGSLDLILQRGGVIYDAVASEVWSGEAMIRVSVVNWIKGECNEPCRLAIADSLKEHSALRIFTPKMIPSSLSLQTDVTEARLIPQNRCPKVTFLGQTHGDEAFLLERDEAEELLSRFPHYRDLLFPFLTGEDIMGCLDSRPTRYVIDFGSKSLDEARCYPELYQRLEQTVYPKRKKKAEEEQRRNRKLNLSDPRIRKNDHHSHIFSRWWHLFWEREELLLKLTQIPRYIACSRVTRYPVMEWIASSIHPNDAVQIFAFADNYSFGILQSSIHWDWCRARCSTLGTGIRYTANTVFDTFPWPFAPTKEEVLTIARAARRLTITRRQLLSERNCTLRTLYKDLEQNNFRDSGTLALQQLHTELDAAVFAAYHIPQGSEILEFLLEQGKNPKQCGIPGIPIQFESDEAFLRQELITSEAIREREGYY